MALVLTAPGQTMLVSLLNLPLRETFGVSPLALNSAYTAATIAASLPLVWVGSLTDRIGPRRMLVLVALLFGGACLFTSQIANQPMILAAFFGLRFLGQGSLALVSSHALAMWFDRRLGTLSGLRQVALFALWALLPALTVQMIEQLGWRQTWAVFGLVVPAVLCPLAWCLVRDTPEELGLAIDGDAPEPGGAPDADVLTGHTLREALRTPAYWVLVSAAVLPPMIGTALLFDIQPLLAARGVDPRSAAGIVGAWSLTMALMALPSGRLVDSRPPGQLLAAGCVAIAASCATWLVVGSREAAIGAMAICAVGQSLIASTVGATTARFFGRRHHGAIRSSLTRIGGISTGLGPLAFGVSQRASGGFEVALAGFALICLPAAVASRWLVSPPEPGGEHPG